MCGITGLVGLFEGTDQLLREMMQALAHRGPDQAGSFIDSGAGVALGHRRLSILDTSEAGRQPMESDRAAVVCNGEIYNYIELRRQLQSHYRFASDSDTEVLLHGFDHWGIQGLLSRIKGMFAFAIYDKREARLHLARDRMGEKPLFCFHDDDGRFAFASELKGLRPIPGTGDVDPESLALYFTFGYVPAPHCIVRRCFKVLPGHRLELDARTGIFETTPYWTLEISAPTRPMGEAEAAERIRHLLDRSMDISLFSDVPLGVLLSGGLDSSILSALAHRRNPAIRTFSVVYDDPSFDESAYSRMMARHLDSEHVELRINSTEARQAVTDMHLYMDEPMSDMSLVPTHLLCRKAREHVTVVVGGDGADELFAGYPTHLAHKLSRLYASIPAFIRRGVLEPGIRALPASYKDFSIDFRLKRFIASAEMDTAARHVAWQAHIPHDERERLYDGGRGMAAALDGFMATLPLSEAPDDFRLIEYLDLATYLPNDILAKVDTAAMAVGLETRCPYLDYELVEFAYALPERLKFRLRSQKHILKQVGLQCIPREIVNRKKHGFGIPIGRWLRNELHAQTRDRLLSGALSRIFPIKPSYVEDLLRQHHRGVSDNRKQIWSLLTLYNWMVSYGLA